MLLSILRDGIKISYCSEIICDNITIGVPMVSFCDIPLMSCSEHRSKYGLYAIGFSKSAFDKIPTGCEIGPVSYFLQRQKELIDNLRDLVQKRDQTVGWFKQFQMIRNGKDQINYDECEWRIIAFENSAKSPISWFWREQDYSKWKEARNDKFLDGIIIPFAPSSIRYIIVNQEKNIPNVVKRILKLKTISGIPVTTEDKEMLCSRIISFEQLKSDF